jgi:hypothetical protein
MRSAFAPTPPPSTMPGQSLISSSCSILQRSASGIGLAIEQLFPLEIAGGRAKSCTRLEFCRSSIPTFLYTDSTRGFQKSRRLRQPCCAVGSLTAPFAFLTRQSSSLSQRVPAAAAAAPILELNDARREAEEMLAQFEVLYPNESVLRPDLRGSAAYQLSWFDANLWVYAEHFALDRILSEDFEHQRLYGAVTVINPFFTAP